MNDDLEVEAYISISNSILGIYLFDINSFKNFYKKEIKIKNEKDELNFNLLNTFLEDNVFKIEKLLGKFINNISLVLNKNNTTNVHFGVKKKIYDDKTDKKYLENLLTDAKDLFRENNQKEKIMHIIINKFRVDEKDYSLFHDNIVGENICLELEFISISNIFLTDIENVFEKYHIKIIDCIDAKYIQSLFNKKNMELTEMAHMVKNGFNSNEVMLVPKKHEKKGFFEKFFQLFS